MSNLNRRDFLKVLGVGSTASLAACDVYWDAKVPMENVLPYVVVPDQIVPGVSTWFATRCDECEAGCGALARNREGRIIKLEGNPDHPVNQGKLCARGQAGLQGTYSPDRFDGPMDGGTAVAWHDAIAKAAEAVTSARAAGKEVAWLGRYRTGSEAMLARLFQQQTGGRTVTWEPLGREALRAATKAVFGRDGVPAYRLDGAHTIVSFGADFLHTWGSVVEQSLGYANSRDPNHGDFVSRLVCIEPRVSNIGALADLYLAAVPGTETGVALALAKLVAEKRRYSGPASALLSGVDVGGAASAAELSVERLEEVAGWMAENASVVLPGDAGTSAAPTDLAIATLILNEVAGNIGKTVVFGAEPNVAGQSSTADVLALLADCKAGKVGVLLLDDLDPVFSLPDDAGVTEALAKVTKVVVFANEPNDSIPGSALVLPPGTTLERWGDAEAHAGVFTLQQPGMVPIRDTRAVGDALLAIAAKANLVPAPPVPEEGEEAAPAESEEQPAWSREAATATFASTALGLASLKDVVAAWWQAVVWPLAGGTGTFQDFWVESLKRGGWFTDVAATGADVVLASAPSAEAATPAGDGLVLTVFAHPFIHDGRHANKPWAQEVPEPVSTYTWGTWIEIHPETAARLGLEKGDEVVVETAAGKIRAGFFASPGIRPDTVAAVLGNGHAGSGRYAQTAHGGNPVKLLASSVDKTSGAAVWTSTRAKVSRAGNKSPLYALAGHMDMDGRNINHTSSVHDLGKKQGPGTIVPVHEVPVDERLTSAGLHDMFPEPEHPTYRFAMAVDLNRCTGCGACETACYSENNIPVVGPEQISKARIMGWIRLSRYWEGEGEHPDVRFQPVMCQHCSHAPCEGVCPVLATYHNLDGLNAMVYNRCVGTRYCANNCPYTARRFNYHTFRWPEPFNMMLNPDVLTREMGVMEKCTFCIQRIRDVKDHYRDEGFDVKAPDSALQKLPACASACPADAMVFGNLKDPESAVSRQFADERAYSMLGELNTKPGVRYLARIVHTESALHHGGHHASAAEGGHEPAAEHHEAPSSGTH